MPAKININVGDTVHLTAEVSHVLDDGTVTVRIHGFSTPVTLPADHVEVVERHRPLRTPKLRDIPD